MKVTIRHGIPGAKLRDAVPPSYRDPLSKSVVPQGTYALLLFAHAERDVVPSRPVRKALRRLGEGPGDGVVAVGTTFTEEALRLLADRGATVVQLRKSRWTDASAAARQR